LVIGSPQSFVLLVAIVILGALWELAQMQVQAEIPPAPVSAVLCALGFPLGAATGQHDAAWLLVTLGVVAGPFWMTLRQPPPNALLGWGISCAVGLYLGVLLAPAILIRQSDQGREWVLAILLATWACDSFAYFVGRTWGRHRLENPVSPGKTREGVLGGIVGGIVTSGIAALAFSLPVALALGLGVVVSIGAVFGDLSESAIKRQLGVKDSGWIMPGHGGILDRMDSLLFTGFLGYLYLYIAHGLG
jgi:phosphatidate cytidylyltransferase